MKTTTIGNLNMKNAKTLRTLLAAVALALPAAAPATTLAPDAGNYSATDQTPFSFVDISGAGGGTSVLSGVDDSAVPLTLPFSFNFYGTAYAQVCVSSNGALYFITDAATCSTTTGDFAHIDLNAGAPAPDLPAIYAYWADLTFQDTGAGSVFYQTLGTAGSRRFIVQWNMALPQGDTSGVTFEAILTEGTNAITLQYQTVSLGAGDNNRNGRTATVGIHNTNGFAESKQQEWSYNSAVLTDGTALAFQASAPSAPALSSPANGATAVGAPVSLTWNTTTGASTYDVYFGTAATPPLVQADTASTNYSATTTAGTTYFWKIAAKNGAGTTESPVFSFTTAAASSGGGSGGGGGGGGAPVTLSPTEVTLNADVGTTAATQTVTLSYQTFTQGAPAFSTNLNTNQGNGWLTVTPTSGTMTQASHVGLLYTYSATFAVKGDPTGIADGSAYTGTIHFTAAGAIASLPVTMKVAKPAVPLPQPTGGIANAASGGQAVASVVTPGSYVAIYGTDMADSGDPGAKTLPLPTTLNGAQATLCGVPVPLLYASATQINLLLPQSLPSTTTCPLVVTKGTVSSAAVTLTVTPLQPGIYTVNTSGSGAGIVTNALTAVLNDADHPARASDFLVIYMTGLGEVVGPNGEAGPADGAAAPSDTVFHTVANVTATIGGVPTPVSFSGLTPTLAGLYQVNVKLPEGVTPGSAVPVVVTATNPDSGATAQSNTVTIVVQ